MSNIFKDGKIIGTFFNRHIDGNPDTRTDLYYIQTKDFGITWTTANNITCDIPVEKVNITPLVMDWASKSKNVYLKDMGFTKNGYPVCLYLISNGHEPGPKSAPYEWMISKWNKKKWETYKVCESDHNYDMGSLYISNQQWKIVAPTKEISSQQYGVGGEIEIWVSNNQGKNWQKEKSLTSFSQYNHAYVRRPLDFKSPFCFFWASGHPHQFSISTLYFGDFDGNIWQLPYNMVQNEERAIKVK